MTANDLRLIDRANDMRRWNFESIRRYLVPEADTNEAKYRLMCIYYELRDLCYESL